MTAQIPDTIFFEDKEYSIVLIRGNELVNPTQFGLSPRSIHTACARGFYLEYTILDEKLYLTKMTVRDVSDSYPAISGVEAYPRQLKTVNDEIIESREHVYDGLQLPVEFSGKFWIARDFIFNMYVHMGFQRPSSFRTVYELSIENGTLTDINDLSEEMERRRQAGCIPFGGLFLSLKEWFSQASSHKKD